MSILWPAPVLVTLGLHLVTISAGAQTILYVDDSAVGAYNGSSWCDAFTNLQDALQEAAAMPGEVTMIRVARGVYKPDQGGAAVLGDRNATFQLLNGVTLHGGFAGCGAPDPDAQDPELFPTVLSGDLGDDDPDTPGYSTCCTIHPEPGCDDQSCFDIVCSWYSGCCSSDWHEGCVSGARRRCPGVCNTRDENCYHVVTANDTDETAVLDGFVIIKGYANESGGDRNLGAGLLMRRSDAVIRGCTFEKNISLSHGAAIYSAGGIRPLIEDCVIRENQGKTAVFTWVSHGRIERCAFEANETAALRAAGNLVIRDSSFLDNASGALEAQSDAYNLSVDRCLFVGNRRGTDGGAIWASSRVDVSVKNSIFLGNESGDCGGAIIVGDRGVIHGCIFSGNSAKIGGAICAVSNLVIEGCTIVGNMASNDAGGLWIKARSYEAPTPVHIQNSVLWANSVGGIVDENAQIMPAPRRTTHGGDPYWGTPPIVDYSCVQGWTGTYQGVGSIGDDPLISDPDGLDGIPGTSDDDLRLLSGSPAADAGNNSLSTMTTDIDGRPRFLDELGSAETGVGIPPIVDMGAYEGSDDCNSNGMADAADIANMLSADCNTNAIPDECERDCNGNLTEDSCDIAAGTAVDCNGDSVPDDCAIENGTSDDCDGNDVPDDCDVANLDCNYNDSPDACDYAIGSSTDCDGNAIPDECDLGLFRSSSPKLFPIGDGFPQSHTFVAPPFSRGDARLTIEHITKSSANPVREIYVRINDEPLGNLRGNSCPTDPDVAVFTIPRHRYNDYAESGSIVIDLVASASVSPAPCYPETYVSLTLEYESVGVAIDCNANGLPDTCDLAAIGSSDCNDNQIIDECDIAYQEVRFRSPHFTPCGAGFPHTFVIPDPPSPRSDVTIQVKFAADRHLSSGGQISFILNGVSFGSTGGGTSAPTPCFGGLQRKSFTMSAEQFFRAVDDKDVIIDIVPGDDMDPYACQPETFLEISISYLRDGTSLDCNLNTIPDECDVADATVLDCDGNVVPDQCELHRNDCDGNGVPDQCDPDCDGDQTPDLCEGNFHDDFEDDRGWTTEIVGASSGQWQRGYPLAPSSSWKWPPIQDSDGTGKCFLTQNEPGNTDIDDGGVRLISPTLDFAYGTLQSMEYDYYLALNNEDGSDALVVEINDDPAEDHWVEVTRHDRDTESEWVHHVVDRSELDDKGIGFSFASRVRFSAFDAGDPSIVEAGVDAFRLNVDIPDCNSNSIPDECDPDSDGDGYTDDCDQWGDFDHDADVDRGDYQIFELCLFVSGPGRSPPFPTCIDIFDSDSSREIDLRDFAILQVVFGN